MFRMGDRVRFIEPGHQWAGRVGTVREIIPANHVLGIVASLWVQFPDGSGIQTAQTDFEPAAVGRHIRDGGRTFRVEAVKPA